MMMLSFTRVKYDRPTEDAPVVKGKHLASGMSPNTGAEPEPDKAKHVIPQEGSDNNGKELLDDGIVQIRVDAIMLISEKRFGERVCSELMLNSGDKILVKQSMSEVVRNISMAPAS